MRWQPSPKTSGSSRVVRRKVVIGKIRREEKGIGNSDATYARAGRNSRTDVSQQLRSDRLLLQLADESRDRNSYRDVDHRQKRNVENNSIEKGMSHVPIRCHHPKMGN